MRKPTLALIASLLLAGLALARPAVAQAPDHPSGVAVAPPVEMPSPQEYPDPVGEKLMELENYGEAAEHYRGALKKDPDNAPACAGLGAALCQGGKPKEALEELGKCIKKMPGKSGLYAARGLCFFLGGENFSAQAEDDYKKALELDPKNAVARNELGLLFQRMGRHDLAIPEFQAAIAADPDLFVAYNNLGASLIATRRFDEAIKVLQQGIARKPPHKGFFLYQNLGIAFLYAGKLPQAEAAFLLEIALNPEHLDGYVNLGNIYLITGRYDDAVFEFYRVLVSDPDNRQALINIGIAYVKSGNAMNGGRYLKKAVELYPDSALAHHYLGLAYQSLGDQDRAAEEQAKAKKQGYNPDASTWPLKPPGP
ncbi:MAG TPA: tetratricopeptide repeat protein [bacterium]|nr:tetratricopeptide repeat protein [bacterium]